MTILLASTMLLMSTSAHAQQHTDPIAEVERANTPAPDPYPASLYADRQMPAHPKHKVVKPKRKVAHSVPRDETSQQSNQAEPAPK